MPLPELRSVEQKLYDMFWADDAPEEEDISGWTKHVSESLERVFAELTICGKGGEEAEYLVDFAGYEGVETDPWSKYRGLALAAECEWSEATLDGLWKDFVKLADVRADRKVFIGNLRAEDFDKDTDALVADWAAHLQAHRHTCKGEQVLVMLFNKRCGATKGSWIIGADGGKERVR